MNEIKHRDIFLTEDECFVISNIVLNNEEQIKGMGPDYYNGTPDNSLTGRYYLFNYLNVPEINVILKPKLQNLFDKLNLASGIYIQCWANTFRKDEGINKHQHGEWKFLCSNLFIDGPEDIGTYYFINKKWTKYKSTPGEFTMFYSQLAHYVPKNKTNDIRMSMAMDMYPSGEWKAKDAWKDIECNEQRYMILNEI